MPAALSAPPPATSVSDAGPSASPCAISPGALPPGAFARYVCHSKVFTLALRRRLLRRRASHSTSAARLSSLALARR